MQIIEIRDAETGVADLEGNRQDVNLSIITDACVGDYVIVHAGFAIEKLDREEADARIRLFEELAALDAADPRHRRAHV
jgi:hydrogenase expression/formation protein HypC